VIVSQKTGVYRPDNGLLPVPFSFDNDLELLSISREELTLFRIVHKPICLNCSLWLLQANHNIAATMLLSIPTFVKESEYRDGHKENTVVE
jgi:hypothetical protein